MRLKGYANAGVTCPVILTNDSASKDFWLRPQATESAVTAGSDQRGVRFIEAQKIIRCGCQALQLPHYCRIQVFPVVMKFHRYGTESIDQ
jgi:hypothetical protein